MASIDEQVLDAVFDALYGAIPAVGNRVYRARQDAMTASECPGIVISAMGEDPTPLTIANDVHEVNMRLQLEIFVHVDSDQVWETAVAAIAVPAHQLVMTATLPSSVEPFAGPVMTGFAQASDGIPASRALVYQCTYYRSATALDVAA